MQARLTCQSRLTLRGFLTPPGQVICPHEYAMAEPHHGRTELSLMETSVIGFAGYTPDVCAEGTPTKHLSKPTLAEGFLERDALIRTHPSYTCATFIVTQTSAPSYTIVVSVHHRPCHVMVGRASIILDHELPPFHTPSYATWFVRRSTNINRRKHSSLRKTIFARFSPQKEPADTSSKTRKTD